MCSNLGKPSVPRNNKSLLGKVFEWIEKLRANKYEAKYKYPNWEIFGKIRPTKAKTLMKIWKQKLGDFRVLAFGSLIEKLKLNYT